jgi:hypothetical protein
MNVDMSGKQEETGEDPQERTARELVELLQELRIVISTSIYAPSPC